MKKFKLVLLLVMTAVMIIVIFQNTSDVQIRFLWMAGQISTVLLLFLMAAGGFFLGLIVALLMKSRRKEKDIES
jgi:uncharacterized integral membrane protein